MTNLPTPELQAAVERASLLAAACDVPGFDHLPIVTRANAAPFAADLRLILAALEARGKALEFYRDGWVMEGDQAYDHNDNVIWVISTEPTDELLADCGRRALTALGGTADV